MLSHLERRGGPVEAVQQGDEAHNKDDIQETFPRDLPG
jgi:hypothetical protein